MGVAGGDEYWVTRFLFQRSLAAIYFVAFLVALRQFPALCGSKGLQPAEILLRHQKFWEAPSLFFINGSDRAFQIAAWAGLILAGLALSGLSDIFGIYFSVAVWFSLWVLYLSFVNVGGTFYSFGWEVLLLEAGFLTIFLGSNDTQPPAIVIWLLRWLLFRLMFGAGLIKLRGDDCWRDLTCMQYHHETQPMPNPLSWYFHHLPPFVHKGAVLFNHIVEIIIPFLYFVPRFAGIAGLFTIVFQGLLIVSGNFSWLNYLSICLAISCFNDASFRWLGDWAPDYLHVYPLHSGAVFVLAALVTFLSIKPVMNLPSPRQIMNTSFDPLHLVNTYGAFGSITRVRREIVIEGTRASSVDATTSWSEYEFKGKPGDVMKRPPLVAPYHHRLDWQMWFSAMYPSMHEEWFLVLMQRLLEGNRDVLSLLRVNPFPETPPTHIRALLYEYRFTTADERAKTGAWWERTLLKVYAPPMTLNADGAEKDSA